MENEPHLPSELWDRIFKYLSVADKLNVRATCTHFKTLIDHWTHWKGWTLLLDFKNGWYNKKFWETIRARRITSVRMMTSQARFWKRLAVGLPTLTTVVMERSTQECVECLKLFPNIRCLVLKSCFRKFWLDFPEYPVVNPTQLTCLSLCGSMYCLTAADDFIPVISQFKNLEQLIFHKTGIVEEPLWLLERFLKCLPKLKHLSVTGDHVVHEYDDIVPWRNRLDDPYSRVLSSLEIVDFEEVSLPIDVMRFLPGLKNLTIFYTYSHIILPHMWSSPSCRMKLWLNDLPQLSSLVIVQGPPVRKYATSIPASLTSLTLCVPGLTSQDMAAISVQTPNLLHLHINPSPTCLGVVIGEIPQLFPKLKSLKISIGNSSDEEFLSLCRLQDLEYLELVDYDDRLSELTKKLQRLTDYRLEIKILPPRRNVLSCLCVCKIY